MLSSEVVARGAGVPRRASLDALLRFAWDAGVFTAGDALAAVGLSRSTTIEAIDDLLVLGLVRELPNARAVGEYSKGRPSRRFELCADAAVVVGVDAGQGHVVTTVADLRGRTLASRTDLVGAEGDSAARRRALVVDAIDAALAEAGQSRGDVLAVCVGRAGAGGLGGSLTGAPGGLLGADEPRPRRAALVVGADRAHRERRRPGLGGRARAGGRGGAAQHGDPAGRPPPRCRCRHRRHAAAGCPRWCRRGGRAPAPERHRRGLRHRAPARGLGQ